MKNTLVGQCPTCGFKKRVLDGTYHNNGGITQYIPTNADERRQILEAIQIIQSGLSRRATNEEIESDLETRVGWIKKITEKIPAPMRSYSFWMFVIAILNLISQCTDNSPAHEICPMLPDQDVINQLNIFLGEPTSDGNGYSGELEL